MKLLKTFLSIGGIGILINTALVFCSIYAIWGADIPIWEKLSVHCIIGLLVEIAYRKPVYYL